MEDEKEAQRKINEEDSKANRKTSIGKFQVDGEDWEGKQKGETWLRWIESTAFKGRG